MPQCVCRRHVAIRTVGGLVLLAVVLAEEFGDPAIGDVLAAVEALRVAAEEDVDAVARALRNPGGVNVGVEPLGERRVPHGVVGRPPVRARGTATPATGSDHHRPPSPFPQPV
ncbi:hypothetical protein [Streptomyces asoensis]|uniref:hypothetical protein n=1 Tax=Streptomyces asoensis TaxID=249586 RepID=UPI003F4CF71E